MSIPYRRLLLVDDSAMFLASARRVLDSMSGIEVVGEATSGEASLEFIDRERPDLVLMDISMPGMGGLEATRRIAARPRPPRVAVIIMSVHDLPQYRDAALAAGAAAFITKSDLAERLHPLIQQLVGTTEV